MVAESPVWNINLKYNISVRSDLTFVIVLFRGSCSYPAECSVRKNKHWLSKKSLPACNLLIVYRHNCPMTTDGATELKIP